MRQPLWDNTQQMMFCSKIENIIKRNKLSYLSTEEFQAFVKIAIADLELPARPFDRTAFLKMFYIQGLKSPVRNHFKGQRHLTMATSGVLH